MVVGVLPTDVVLRKSGVVSLQFRSFHPLNRAPMSICSGRLSFVLMKLQIHCTCTTHNIIMMLHVECTYMYVPRTVLFMCSVQIRTHIYMHTA